MFFNKKTKPLLLVVNPKAGKCTAKHKLYDLVSYFSRFGYEVTVYPTKRNETSLYVQNNAHRYERIVCCGGDGTLSEVLAGVYKSGLKTPVGYIPMGSTNDYANNMSIQKKLPLAALTAARGYVMDYDLGLFNGTPFSYVAAVGAFTAASYSTPQKLKNSIGHLAYIIEGAKSITNIKPIPITVEVNGKTVKDNFIYISVGNTLSMGGVLKLNKKDVDFCDGKFEVLLLKHPKNAFVAIEMITDLLAGRFKTKNIALLHTNRVKFTFEKPTIFSLDGEKSEPCTEAVVTNKHAATRVIVPTIANNKQ